MISWRTVEDLRFSETITRLLSDSLAAFGCITLGACQGSRRNRNSARKI